MYLCTPCNTRKAREWRKLLRQWQDDPTCPLCGIEFTWSHNQLANQVQTNSITIDRIIPKLGYIDKNCRLICHRCNSAKGRSTDDLLQYAKMLLENSGFRVILAAPEPEK